MARISPIGSVTTIIRPITGVTDAQELNDAQQTGSVQAVSDAQQTRNVQEINDAQQTRNVQEINDAQQTVGTQATDAAPEEEKVNTSRIRMMQESQLQMLYRQGKISYDAMSKETDRRDRIQEMEEAATEQASDEKKVDAASADEKAARIETEEKKAERTSSDEKAEKAKTDDADRKGAQQTDRREQVAEASADVNQRMGRINAVMQDFSLIADAQERAAKNDREEMMANIIQTQIIDPIHK